MRAFLLVALGFGLIVTANALVAIGPRADHARRTALERAAARLDLLATMAGRSTWTDDAEASRQLDALGRELAGERDLAEAVASVAAARARERAAHVLAIRVRDRAAERRDEAERVAFDRLRRLSLGVTIAGLVVAAGGVASLGGRTRALSGELARIERVLTPLSGETSEPRDVRVLREIAIKQRAIADYLALLSDDEALREILERTERAVAEKSEIIAEQDRRLRHDPLTGLLSKTGFVTEAIARIREGVGDRLALAFLDLDTFKAVNDRHGHEHGDRAIGHFAGILADLVRPGELAARPHGDEFFVLLDGGHARMRAFLAEFDDATRSRPFAIADTASFEVTATTGYLVLSDVPPAAALSTERAVEVQLYVWVADCERAMKHAKLTARGTAAEYRPWMRQRPEQDLDPTTYESYELVRRHLPLRAPRLSDAERSRLRDLLGEAAALVAPDRSS